jgi:predicted component of type VI protein secretion system
MDAKLVVVGGRADRSEIQIVLPMIIGRQRDSDLVIVHKSVSRQHCDITERNNMLVVRDRNSSNGTYINDVQINEAYLRPGDCLRVGPLTFRAEYVEGAKSQSKYIPTPTTLRSTAAPSPPPAQSTHAGTTDDFSLAAATFDPEPKAPTGESDVVDLSAWGLKAADDDDFNFDDKTSVVTRPRGEMRRTLADTRTAATCRPKTKC